MLHGLVQDALYGLRQLRRRPAFACAAVLTLSLAVSVCTSVVAIADAVVASLTAGARYDQVQVLKVTEPRREIASFSSMALPDLRRLEHDHPSEVTAVGAVGFQEAATVTAPGCAEMLNVVPVTGEYARVFDLRPQAGRWLNTEDDRDGQSSNVAVLSDRVWRDWFAADPAAVGAAVIRINQMPFTVVGVAEPVFRGVMPGPNRPEVWIPQASTPRLYAYRPQKLYGNVPLTVFIKSRPAIPVAQLRDRLQPFVTQRTAGTGPSLAVSIAPLSELNAAFTKARLFALGFAALVLLAAGANFANMLLARGAQRSGELAVRLSLGASRSRIFRLLLTESMLIGILAGAVGLMLALVATSVFSMAYPSFLVDRINVLETAIHFDLRLVAYAVGCGVAASVAAGALSSARAVRIRPGSVLLSEGVAAGIARRGALRTTMVAVQVTAALMLVMGAGLFLENQPKDLDLDKRIHYDSPSITAGRIDLSLMGYTEARGQAVFDRMLAASERMANVDRAALADGIPGAVGDAAPAVRPLIAEAPKNWTTRPPRRIRASVSAVSPSFLDALGIPLLRGRLFTQWDANGSPPVAIVSASTAEALYPNDEALGKRVQLGFGGAWASIVGIAADPVSGRSNAGVFERPSNVAFVPILQHYNPKTFIVIRSAQPAALVGPLRAAMRGIDDRAPLYRPSTLDDRFLAWAAPARAARMLMVTLAATALAIAMLGVAGVISYAVSLRTREFGIRLALGATRRSIVKLVVDHAIHVLLVGLLCGVTVTTLTSRVLEQRLSRLMPNQIATWTVVPLLLLGIGVLAAYVPARRAGRVDPNVALRDL